MEEEKVLSIHDQIEALRAKEIDLTSVKAANDFDVSLVSAPPAKTKVMLFEYLTLGGLHHDSPLFNKLFDHFGQKLILK